MCLCVYASIRVCASMHVYLFVDVSMIACVGMRVYTCV